MQPGFEFGEDASEGHLGGRSGRRVIDEQHLNLHRRVRPFGAKHHVICPTQLLHAQLLSPPNLVTRLARCACMTSCSNSRRLDQARSIGHAAAKWMEEREWYGGSREFGYVLVGRQHRVRTTPVPAKAPQTHQGDDNAGGDGGRPRRALVQSMVSARAQPLEEYAKGE